MVFYSISAEVEHILSTYLSYARNNFKYRHWCHLRQISPSGQLDIAAMDVLEPFPKGNAKYPTNIRSYGTILKAEPSHFIVQESSAAHCKYNSEL